MLNIPQSLANSAYSGTSFDPVGRGKRAVEGYESDLQSAIETMRQHAAKGGTEHLLPTEVERFISGYRRRVLALMHSESRCVSSFIAGPSNFPARRMNKRSDIAHKRLNELFDFRARALRAAIRDLRPDLRPIMSGDADALERLESEIDKLERVQARMKTANVAIRKYANAGQDHQVAALMEQGFTEARSRDLLKPDSCGRIGFADYELTNNGANIRRLKARFESLTAAKAAPVQSTESESGITLEDDPPANRIRLIFPGKPDESIRSRLKAGGFRWAPSIGAWQAYRHPHTLQLAQTVAGV